MASILIPICVIVGLILAVGLMSLSESALLSARRWRLKARAARGENRAAAALKLTEQLERFVPAIRVGAAAAGSLTGVCAGLWLQAALGPAEGDSVIRRVVAVGAVAGAIALVSLLLGDLLPRKIARRWPERIACSIARPMAFFVKMTGPVSRCLESTTELAARWLGFQSAARPPVTQEEIKGLLWEGTKAGVFEEAEYDIFRRVFLFCERRGRVLMTPRDEVVWIDVGDSPDEICRKVIGSPHSRFPVCDQSLDNLLGIVQVKDLLAQHSDGPAFRVKGLLSLPAFIYAGTRGPQILEILKKSSTHTAVVLDEYGSVVGLLTLSDIINAVLGELPEGNGDDETSRSVLRQADGSLLVDGRFPLDEFRELVDLAELPSGDFHTLAGLVINQLGHIPRVSESFELLGFHFEVVEMDSQRVNRVLVRPLGR
jgi:putative hemolysin